MDPGRLRQRLSHRKHTGKRYTNLELHVEFMMRSYAPLNRFGDATLNRAQVRRLVLRPCYYCGRNRVNGTYNGIDRKYSHRNYTLANCVPCCRLCNVAKNVMEPERFVYLARLVAGKHARGKCKCAECKRIVRGEWKPETLPEDFEVDPPCDPPSALDYAEFQILGLQRRKRKLAYAERSTADEDD